MKVFLKDAWFAEKETTIVEDGEFAASIFRYPTGVAAVRVKNGKGEFTALPFRGQMVWRCSFLGRELAMKSIYDVPQDCERFGHTYGCFLMHCGLTAMGNPTAADTHFGHGELPLAKYDEAWIEVGADKRGKYIALGGVYNYMRCFEANYSFSPCTKLYAGETKMVVDVSFTNHKDLPLEYYYLCHVNHRPVDGSKLLYTADPKTAIINHEVPDGYRKDWADATNAFLARFDKDHTVGDKVGVKGESYRPEIVNCFFHHAAKDGKAYTMQVHPDGTSIYVAHNPKELPYGTRWIARTDDEDAMGMCLPATSEHKGRLFCQAHKQQRVLKTGKSVSYHVETGFLDRAATKAMAKLVADANKKIK